MNKAHYYLDRADSGEWLVKGYEKRYRAGFDKTAVVGLISRLNEAHRPNIESRDGALYVCWNNHDKSEKCEWERVIETEAL